MPVIDNKYLYTLLKKLTRRVSYVSAHPAVPLSIESDFADDTAAATGGIQVGEFYHTSGTVKIRLS